MDGGDPARAVPPRAPRSAGGARRALIDVDLHMHTDHSPDCATPVEVLLATAKEQGLGAIAITDHNTDSQYDQMRELQPFFDHLLLIPGREMTTFHGHFNIFGVTQFMNWRVSKGALDVNTVLRDARSKGGIASVNHAESAEGEAWLLTSIRRASSNESTSIWRGFGVSCLSRT